MKTQCTENRKFFTSFTDLIVFPDGGIDTRAVILHTVQLSLQLSKKYLSLYPDVFESKNIW